MNASTDPVFVALAGTGSDLERDGLWFFEAAAFPADEGPRPVIPALWCSPYAPGEVPERAPRRLAASGLTGERLKELPSWREVLPPLLEALEARPVVVADRAEDFLTRFTALRPDLVPPRVLALTDLATFLHPRRGELRPEQLLTDWCGREPGPVPEAAELRQLLTALVRGHFERPGPVRQLVARALVELLEDPGGRRPERSAEWLELVVGLLDRPSRYGAGGDDDDALFFAALEDGAFEDDVARAPLDLDRHLRGLTPRFQEDYQRDFDQLDPLSSRVEDPAPLGPEAQERLRAYFDLLPRHFAGDGEDPVERPGQRALAGAMAERFGHGPGYLLADAPTGTGKTLAYLAPLLLWAEENQVRVAVSTYTRTLQEQAFFRELPRALDLLESAGLPRERRPRTALLKGRANYICGRAILDAAPEPAAASAVARATWMRLALFFLEDQSADLDGFPLMPGLPGGHPGQVLRAADGMLRKVRALPNCCRGRAAKRCAAGVRTLRAERAHLVVTNHAYLLARPDDFSHVLCDECDHLHEVTLSARSFDIELDEVVELVSDLRRARRRDAGALAVLGPFLERLSLGEQGERLREAKEESGGHADALDAAAHLCAREMRAFEGYRREAMSGLTREESAFLLHEYMSSGRGDGLLTALRGLRDALDGLDSALRTVIEELGDLPQRRARKLRWELLRPLESLAHWREGLQLWLGGDSDEGDFSDTFHFEAIFEQRQRPLLALKLLLPQEWLGRVYYPSLRHAFLVSATARLRGGFKAMSGYLGLDLVTQEDPSIPAEAIATFRGAPHFDHRAALYCVPEDAPPYAYRGPDAEEWQDYVEDLLVFLGERTRGRILGLFTNRLLLARAGERLAPRFRALGLPFYWQGMPGTRKEEIMRRFLQQEDAVLLGLDTFWFGVDFPGTTCEYVVMPKLPYGAPDDYMTAQQARMGWGPQRHRIYLPKALAMFRQGCGRLLRTDRDRGAVFLLDRRVLDKKHADFLEELPGGKEPWQRPEIVQADTDTCLQRTFAHMQLLADLERRGLDLSFSRARRELDAHGPAGS